MFVYDMKKKEKEKQRKEARASKQRTKRKKETNEIRKMLLIQNEMKRNAEGGNKNCIRNGKELMLMDLYKYYFQHMERAT